MMAYKNDDRDYEQPCPVCHAPPEQFCEALPHVMVEANRLHDGIKRAITILVSGHEACERHITTCAPILPRIAGQRDTATAAADFALAELRALIGEEL